MLSDNVNITVLKRTILTLLLFFELFCALLFGETDIWQTVYKNSI